MSIDTKEWGGKLNEMGMLPEVVSFSRFTQWVIDLIRAVIADEAAKAQQPAEPRADDPLMPNWFCEGYAADDGAIFLWRKVIDELTRRMSEATAERDRRIAELEATNKSLLDGRREIRQELVEAKQQLAASQAEVERLKNARCRILSNGDRCDCTLCKQDAELAKLREENARLTRPVEGVCVGDLVEAIPPFTLHCGSGWYQNAVVTSVRPLVLVSCSGDMLWSHTVKPENIRTVGKPMPSILASAMKRFWTDAWGGALDGIGIESVGTQAERNAREAAEAERDELREAWDWHNSRVIEVKGVMEPTTRMTVEKMLTEFAAYRAEKGKVTK